jgi:hypothetical protein
MDKDRIDEVHEVLATMKNAPEDQDDSGSSSSDWIGSA